MMLIVHFSYMAFSTKLEQKNFNVYGIAKATLRKKNRTKGIKLSNFRLHYKL